MIKELIITMRPNQWYKNLVLLVSIVFSLNILNPEMWSTAILALFIFCLLSGGEYIFNDILDREKDKMHPRKQKRPIASGKFKLIHAKIFAIIIITGGIIAAYFINVQFMILSISYVLLILSYSLILKHLIIVDLLVISIGFVIRAIAGGVAINVFISPWLIVCTFLVALFLAIAKRRHEVVLLGDGGKNHRKILSDYSTVVLDQMMSISTAALIISYSMYTFLSDNYYMMLTIPFAIYGIFRYLLLVHISNFGGEAEMLFKDKGMQICIGLWGLTAIIVLYKDKLGF
ncbi:MAG TPA: decaprenyl-phosphate phosphoribosyltransferase [Candidatus Methylomirabilis sp.]|nr:decaprenyl-phosphate phosphoribosyltransferase [Candidatus Methylomirabilis sp.]